MHTSQPIGIFDSGLGGLTVAHAVKQALPHETILYFGDTAHLPYGDKSASTLHAYVQKICEWLMERQCKVILWACNSATAACFDAINAEWGAKVPMINVIDPVAEYISRQPYKTVGLIGTRTTVNSEIYKRKIEKINPAITVKACPTPLLVPLIEEGYARHTIMKTVLAEYLKSPGLSDIQALILGCTHYPLIENLVRDFYQSPVEVVESSALVTRQLIQLLTQLNLLQPQSEPGQLRGYLSDYTESFAHHAESFFQEKIKLYSARSLFEVLDFR